MMLHPWPQLIVLFLLHALLLQLDLSPITVHIPQHTCLLWDKSQRLIQLQLFGHPNAVSPESAVIKKRHGKLAELTDP
jgi:hypothetical protein